MILDISTNSRYQEVAVITSRAFVESIVDVIIPCIVYGLKKRTQNCKMEKIGARLAELQSTLL